MVRLLPECRDAVVLEAMIDNVLGEGEFFSAAERTTFCRQLKRCVCELDPAEFKDRKQRDKFVALY